MRTWFRFRKFWISSKPSSETGSRPLRLFTLPKKAAHRVAKRRSPGVLGRAEHRVLRARAPEEPLARLLGAAGAGCPQLFLSRLRQPRRLLAHGRGDGPLRRARQRVAQRCGLRAPPRGG